VTLTNLTDNSKYFFKVKSRDKFGNLAESGVREAMTSLDNAAPAIIGVKSESGVISSGETSRIQIVISWSTDEPATSMVEYGEGIGSSAETLGYSFKTEEDQVFNQSHLVIISGLKPSTTYHFRILAKDMVGNESKSGDYTILTPPKDLSVLQLILKSWEETFSWVNNLKRAIPFWPF
jgi:hypothetical protein